MRFALGMIGLLLTLGSCSNAWRDLPNKSSDEYYIDLARQHLNRFEFDEAISRITPILVSQPRNPDVVQIAVLSYAGRAGLRVLDFVLELGSDSNTKTYFRIFAEHFRNVGDSEVEDMAKAVEILETYEDDPDSRTSEFNLIAMFLYYGRLGVTLHRYAYDNNAIDPTFDHCSTVDLPDESLTTIVQSLSKALASSSSVSDSGGVGAALDALVSQPEIQVFAGADNAECPADNLRCQSMRSLVGEGSLNIGLGSGAPVLCP